MHTIDQKHTANTPFRRAALVVAVSLGLGILSNILFFDHTVGVSFPIFVVVALVCVVVMARRYRVRIPTSALATAVPLLFFSGMVAVRANEFITFWDIVMSVYLAFLMLYLVYRPALRRMEMSDYLAVPFKQLAAYTHGAQRTLSEFAGMRQFVRKHEHFPQIVRGVAIAVPVLVVFTALFASADLVFRTYVGDLFSFHINDTVIGRTIMIGVVTLAAIGAFTYLLRKPEHTGPSATSEARAPWFGTIETAILFGSLNALFVMFIIVQLAYLFGGQNAISHQGFTYAQYARKGFFELITVAVISSLLIWYMERSAQRGGQGHSTVFKWLSAALIGQVIVIMVSAFKRLALYENAYGFTSLRLYSHVIIIWLAVVFCFLLYKIFRDRRESTFAALLFVSVLAVLACVNVWNTDAFIARKNIARYEATHKLDVGYISSLSADAMPETVKLLHAPDPQLRSAYAGVLYRQQTQLSTAERPWQSKNIGRESALAALRREQPTLERNKNQDLQYLVMSHSDVLYR